MATQPTQLQAATKAKSPDYLAPLADLLTDKNELDLSSIENFQSRIAAMQAIQEKAPANYIGLEQNILSQLPAGASLMPLPIIPQEQDGWRGAEAKKMKLKDGHVEPSALFLNRLASILGIQLIKKSSTVDSETGRPYYQVLYDAKMMLPNGEVIQVNDIGKAQPLFTSEGYEQAHVRESTETKARRNAIKVLLGIPTSMPEEQFNKPWVVFRPIFREGQSQQVDQIIKLKQEQQQASVASLYNTQQTIDVQAQTSDSTIDELASRMEKATTLEELQAVMKEAARIPMSDEQKSKLRAIAKPKNEAFKSQEQASKGPAPISDEGKY